MEISSKRIPRIEKRLDLDLFGERHAVGLEHHVLEDGAAKDPHAGLRITHPTKEQNGRGRWKDQVAHLVFKAHGAAVAHGKPRGVEEVGFEVKKGFQQVGDGIGRIAVIAIERDDDVAGCPRNPVL
jgi:hypothetical protein